MKKLKKLFVLTLMFMFVFALSGVGVLVAGGTDPVNPPVVTETLAPGESYETPKTVGTPEIAPKLDFLLLIDLSGSYWDDLPNIKDLDDGIFESIRAQVTDSQFAVASFIDYPTAPWGGEHDYPFHLDKDFTADQGVWTGAIDGLGTLWGWDWPESQYAGLKGAAEMADWRKDATKVIAITTDAPFHNEGDTNTYNDEIYPEPSREATIQTLKDAGIKVIAIKAGDASLPDMDDIAAETGGSVVHTDNTSSEIAEAILEGLGKLPITVTPHVIGCDPLEVTLTPSSQTVTSGDVALFTEMITVPDDTLFTGIVECSVIFTDEYNNEIGVQTIKITIPDTIPPVLECIPGVNPSGKKIPPAGEKSPGQNEDGFYQIFATDNSGEDLELSINIFGGFASGDIIKITEAPGIKFEKSEKIGGKKFDFVKTHLILKTDAVLTATDSAGNTTSVTCLVPPDPK